MLGPFRIRNLSRHPGQATTSARGRRFSNSDAVVSVDGDRYDGVISTEPSARLQYFDTDQDLITIGSSRELKERLADPVPLLDRARPPQGFPIRSSGMHSFDIAPVEAASKIWKEIEQETAASMREASKGIDAALREVESALGEAPSRKGKAKIPAHTEPSIATSTQEPARNEEDKHLEPEVTPSSSTGVAAGRNRTTGPEPGTATNSLAQRRSVHFSNCSPPQAYQYQPTPTDLALQHLQPMSAAAMQSLDKATGVLTSHGVEQAREEGAKLRARLSEVNNASQFYASSTTRPENRWASYHQQTDPLPVPMHANTETLDILKKYSAQTVPALRGMDISNPADKLSPPGIFKPYRPSQEMQPSSDKAVGLQDSGNHDCALNPAFYEGFQARLDKLNAYTAVNPISTELPKPTHNQAQPQTPQEALHGQLHMPTPNVDLREPLEVMVGKMISQSVDIAKNELLHLSGQITEHVLPRVPEEALKLKGYPSPAQTKEMWGHLDLLIQALKTFREQMESARLLACGYDGHKTFPHGSGMIDFGALNLHVHSFSHMVQAMKQLTHMMPLTTTPVRNEEASQPSIGRYRIPKRLTAFQHEDTWIIALVISKTWDQVQVLSHIDKARALRNLPRTHIKSVKVSMSRDAGHANVEFAGRSAALETWDALFDLESDPAAPMPTSITRQAYPEIYHSTDSMVPSPPKPASHKPSPSTAQDAPSVDAKLKGIQERRAAWAKEYKARAPNVRFNDSVEEIKSSNSYSRPVHESLGTRPKSGLSSSGQASKQPPQRPPRPMGPWGGGMPARHSPRAVEGPQHRLKAASSMAALREGKRHNMESRQEVRKRLSMPLMGGNYTATKAAALQPVEPPTEVAPAPPNVAVCSWKPLDPIKLNDPKPQSSEARAYEQPQKPLGAWPEDIQLAESSGAFARRMMGRSPAPSHLISPLSSPTLKAIKAEQSQPAAPMTFLGTGPPAQFTYAPAFDSDLNRRHTVAGRPEKSAGGPWSRRPYSMTFDGSGRTDGTPRVFSEPPVPVAEPQSTTSPGGEARVQQTVRNTSVESTDVSECVRQLKELGYGTWGHTSTERLLMYAEAAKGNLEEAIDLIEEEREAWQQQGLPREQSLGNVGHGA